MVKIEGYEVFAELQRGAWVTLFKAFDLERGRTVLIKLLNEQHAPPAVQEQLRVESESSARLVHPNLRRVDAAGKLGERHYLVLEYVEGPTLAELIARRLPIEFCVWIAKQVAQALAAVHGEGLLHRDVKPRNIFTSWEGEVKLGDLGLAVDLDEVSVSLAGTPAYFAPEIVLGQKISASSDLFSLGAVLYEMLTAAPPFADHTTSATLHRIANLEPTPVAKLRPEVPAELAALCRMLLSKTPEARCRSAEEVAAILTQLEYTYGLKTSAERFASYLQAPENYQPVKFAPPVLHAHETTELAPSFKPQTQRNSRRALTWFIAAGFVLGLVLLNWGREDPQSTISSQTEPETIDATVANPPAAWHDSLTTIAPAQPAAQPREKVMQEKTPPPAITHNGSPARPPAALFPENDSPQKNTSETFPGPAIWLLSEPRANVFVENKSLGVTPLRWTMPQSEQVYELRFLAPMLPEVRTLVTAAILESDTLRVNLWKELAYLEVTVNPWGEIWLDGKPVDTTPLVAPIKLAPGLHELAVRHPQLGTRSLRIVLTKGDTLRRTFDLFTP